MSLQSSLTENPPCILDSTCSFRKIWPRYATIRIDIRPETHPDIVMDAGHTGFPTQYFDEIYCDPPHLIAGRKIAIDKFRAWVRRTGRKEISMFERYGYWVTRQDWHDFLRKTNEEFYRIIKANGILHYKITDGKTRRGYKGGATHLEELLQMMSNFVITDQRVTQSKSRMSKYPSKVYWLKMRPKA